MTLVVLLVAALVAAGLVVVAQRSPFGAIVVFLLVVAFVPVWFVAPLGFITVSAASAVAGLLAVSLAPAVSELSLGLADLLAAFMAISVVVATAVGLLQRSTLFSVVTIWVTAWLAGRLILLRVDPGRLYAAMGLIFGVVALLAIIEFVLQWHPLASWGPHNGAWATWSTIQLRAGLGRAEGAFGHSIALGMSLAMVAVITLDAALPRYLRFILIVLMVGGIGVTLSRGALLSAVVGLLLAIVFLPQPRVRELRGALVAALVVGGTFGIPALLGVLAGAGDEAQGSAQYRADLTGLIGSIELIGRSSAVQTTASGNVYIGSFQSIDNQFLVFGVSQGWIMLGLVLASFGLAAVAVVTGRGTTPAAAMVAQALGLATVALITQYAVLFWFVFGLACAADQLRRAETADTRADPVPLRG